MRRSKLFIIGTFAAIAAVAQQTPTGAKALFLDTQTGRVTMPKVSRGVPGAAGGSVQVPSVTGLMYYLELVSPTGELSRVNSSRVFHSGEKFRLHVSSNIDGWLTILQSQDGGKFDKLLPTASLPAVASNIKKGVDTILPAPGSWFKFDERPGEIRVLMMLTAESAGGTTLIAANKDVMPDAMQAFEQLQRGSKALLIEAGDSPKDGYEVKVVNSSRDKQLPPGQIVVDLRLVHRPRP